MVCGGAQKQIKINDNKYISKLKPRIMKNIYYSTKQKCMTHKLVTQKGYQVKINTVFTLDDAINMSKAQNNTEIIDTLKFIYAKTEGGAIFCNIAKKPKFTALINIKYRNSWNEEMNVTLDDIKRYIKEKDAVLGKTTSKKYVHTHAAKLKPINAWTNNGCLINMYSYNAVFNSYTYELIHMISSCNLTSKTNFAFIIWLKDFPMLPYTIQGKFLPILSQSTCPNFRDIAIPNNEEWAMITRLYFPPTCNFEEVINILVPWENKIEKGFFRGSGTGCFSDKRNPRFNVARLSRDNPDILDAGIIRCTQRDKMEDDGITFIWHNSLDFALKDPLPMPLFGRYKYILSIKGNGAAYRLPYLFFLGSVILIVETKFKLWFEPALVKWYHYIPISEDLSDLIEILTWCKCKDNDAQCKKIAQNGLEFAQTWFTKKNIIFYLTQTFKSLGLSAK